MKTNDAIKNEVTKWKKPCIEVKEIFEKTALACDGSAFYNGKYNNKASGSICGYWFS